MPAELKRLRQLLRKGLQETAALFPRVRVAYCYVWRVAKLLKNRAGLCGRKIKAKLQRLLRQMRGRAARDAGLAKELTHFVKVSKSFAPGLFACYEVPGVPRTNNDLEQLFGSQRYQERRCRGRKKASGSLVVRGEVRLVAAVLTRHRAVPGEELAPEEVSAWQQLRQRLQKRRRPRVQGRRFRRDPRKYLGELEAKLSQLGLPF